MKKNALLNVLLALVFIVVFSVVFFLNGGADKGMRGWISFGFIMLAYLFLLLTRYMGQSDKAVLGLSVYAVSTTYFFIQFTVGLILLFAETIPDKICLSIQVVMLGIYIALLISTLIANNNTSESLKKQEKEVTYIKETASKVKLLLDKTGDKELDRVIQRVYDLLHASPTGTDLSVYDLEEMIVFQTDELCEAVKQNYKEKIISVADELEMLIEKRNAILKNRNY